MPFQVQLMYKSVGVWAAFPSVAFPPCVFHTFPILHRETTKLHSAYANMPRTQWWEPSDFLNLKHCEVTLQTIKCRPKETRRSMNEHTTGKPFKLLYFHTLFLYGSPECLWTAKSIKWEMPQSTVCQGCCLSLLFISALSHQGLPLLLYCASEIGYLLCGIYRPNFWKPL